jgi:hypothetical protein
VGGFRLGQVGILIRYFPLSGKRFRTVVL